MRLVKRMLEVAVVAGVGVGETRRGVGLVVLAFVEDQGWGFVAVI